MTHRQNYACVVFAKVSSHEGFWSCVFIIGTICTVVNLNESKTKEYPTVRQLLWTGEFLVNKVD